MVIIRFIKFIVGSVRRTFIAQKLNSHDKRLEELYTLLGLKYYNGSSKQELDFLKKEISAQKKLVLATYKKIGRLEKKYQKYADNLYMS